MSNALTSHLLEPMDTAYLSTYFLPYRAAPLWMFLVKEIGILDSTTDLHNSTLLYLFWNQRDTNKCNCRTDSVAPYCTASHSKKTINHMYDKSTVDKGKFNDKARYGRSSQFI